MSDQTLIVMLLAVMTTGVLAMALAVVRAAEEVRRAARQLSAVLPKCDRAAGEITRTFEAVGRFAERANHAADRIEEAVQGVSGAAVQMIDALLAVRARVTSWLMQRHGNGVGAEPHRIARRHRKAQGG